MPTRVSLKSISSEFIRDLESQTRKELKSRLKEFHLRVDGYCLSMKFKFVDRPNFEFRVVVDPQLFGHWKGIPSGHVERELRKIIASVLSSADRGYHRNHDN